MWPPTNSEEVRNSFTLMTDTSARAHSSRQVQQSTVIRHNLWRLTRVTYRQEYQLMRLPGGRPCGTAYLQACSASPSGRCTVGHLRRLSLTPRIDTRKEQHPCSSQEQRLAVQISGVHHFHHLLTKTSVRLLVSGAAKLCGAASTVRLRIYHCGSFSSERQVAQSVFCSRDVL